MCDYFIFFKPAVTFGSEFNLDLNLLTDQVSFVLGPHFNLWAAREAETHVSWKQPV